MAGDIDQTLSILGGSQPAQSGDTVNLPPIDVYSPGQEPPPRPEGFYGGRQHINIPGKPSVDKTIDTLSSAGSLAAPVSPDNKSTVSTGGAVWAGAKQGATLGFSDELAGLLASHNYLAGQTDLEGNTVEGSDSGSDLYKKINDAYTQARDTERANDAAAQQQHPVAYLGGNIGASLAIPGGAVARSAGVGARVARGALTGALTGGISGIGSGTDTQGRALGGAIGGIAGGVLGGALPAVAAGSGIVGRYIGDKTGLAKVPELWRAWRDPDKIASQKIVTAIGHDTSVNGGGLTPSDVAAARQSGQPAALIDTGGETTRALAKSAANESPNARTILSEQLAEPRYKEQATRTASFLDNMMGGNTNSVETRESLKSAARAANRPAYEKTYAEGDRSIWSPELERLSGSPDVTDAMRQAVRTGKGQAIADKFGAFNPSMRVTEDGRLLPGKGANGVPTYPNIQFWDYTLRNLNSEASKAFRAGDSETGGRLSAQASQLRAELDNQVPSFKDTRSAAAKFFGKSDALEAGGEFAMARGQNDEFRSVINKMSDPEKKLFSDGFASRIIAEVREKGDRANIVNQIYQSPAARERVEMALGSQKAGELEMFLRRENIIDKLRGALGNSTTARQLKEHLMAGGAGVGIAAGDAYLQGDLDWSKALTGLAGFAALEGRMAISKNLALKVAQKLASQDPKEWKTVMRMGAQNPKVLSLTRYMESALEKMVGQQSGREASGASAPNGTPAQK